MFFFVRIFILSFLAIVALGRGAIAFSMLNEEDEIIYKESLLSCHQFNSRTPKNFDLTPTEKKIVVGSFSDTLAVTSGFFADKNANLVFKQTNGLGQYMHRILNSMGFMKAMKECFPNNELYEHLYVGHLLFFDAISKGIVLGATIIPITTLFRKVSFLRKIFTTPFGRKAGVSFVVVGSISGSTDYEPPKSFLENLDSAMEMVAKEVQEIKRQLKEKQSKP